MTPAEASRAMQTYAKGYNAGAFAMPTTKDLVRDGFDTFGDGNVIVARKRLTRGSVRNDWLGRPYEIPGGSLVATHISRSGPFPETGALDRYDVLVTYVEDTELTSYLHQSGRIPWATRISAAAEILQAWTWEGTDPLPVAPVDRVTVAEMPLPPFTVPPLDLDGWDDDYPYYSDGSWSALSLRGFWPDDPTRGVKPAEMDKAWKQAHPEDLARDCDWTSLADQLPDLKALSEAVAWGGGLERVRLLRMAGTDGKPHVLRRHSDITDRNFGTADGQVIRLHVPLVTHPEITMTTWDLDGTVRDHHLGTGSAWYLDARKPHSVINPTPVDRVHLTVDVISSPTVRERIEAARCCAST